MTTPPETSEATRRRRRRRARSRGFASLFRVKEEVFADFVILATIIVPMALAAVVAGQHLALNAEAIVTTKMSTLTDHK